MPELREPETDPTRFIRLPDGTIYGYTSLLAKRRDVTIVDGYAAAQWFKSQGVENDVTREFPDTAPLDPPRPGRPVHPPSMKPNRNLMKQKMLEDRQVKMAERKRRLDLLKQSAADAGQQQGQAVAVEPEPVSESAPKPGSGPDPASTPELDAVVKGLIGDVSVGS